MSYVQNIHYANTVAEFQEIHFRSRIRPSIGSLSMLRGTVNFARRAKCYCCLNTMLTRQQRFQD